MWQRRKNQCTSLNPQKNREVQKHFNKWSVSMPVSPLYAWFQTIPSLSRKYVVLFMDEKEQTGAVEMV